MKKIHQVFFHFVLLLFILTIWIPIWIIVFGSFMDKYELWAHLSPIYQNSNAYASWVVLPQYPTLKAYVEVLLDTPEFFKMFWNSCKLTFPTIFGQCLVAIPGAWGLAHFHFKGKNAIFFFYIVLMLMPFQVTMVSSYLALNSIQLMDTIWAVVLPSLFSTFPVFIMCKFFSTIPQELFEAAALDGANEFTVFLRIGLPLGFPGVISALVLSFVENWNAIEQPLTFIKNKALWPLTLFLPDLAVEQIGLAFVASIIIMMPTVFIFAIGKRHLEEGISTTGIKG